MRGFDLTPLYRSTVGFDRLFDLMDSASKFESQSTYPPYNIERLGEDAYRITMAVAGFSDSDLNIESKENTLLIRGEKAEDVKDREFLHQGIAARTFERRFELADHVKVTGAALENGLLHVDLVREIPEEAKPRRIEIASGGPKTISGRKAA